MGSESKGDYRDQKLMGVDLDIDVDVENTVFVAVGKLVRESELTLLWAARSFAGKNLCLLHVHQPAPFITFLDARPTSNNFKQKSMNAFHELEVLKIRKLLHQYVLLLYDIGVEADKVWIQSDNIEKGITDFVHKHDVRWLVMGAAADTHYTEAVEMPISKKALYLLDHAPPSCKLWFTCMGHLIYTRKVSEDDDSDTEGSEDEVTEASEYEESDLTDEDQEEVSVLSPREAGLTSIGLKNFQTKQTYGSSIPPNNFNDKRCSCNADGDGVLVRVSQNFKSQCSLNPVLFTGSRAAKAQLRAVEVVEHRLQQARSDVEKLKHEASVEAVKMQEAEGNLMESICKAETMESLCKEEISRRKEMEEALIRLEEELEIIKNEQETCLREIEEFKDQKPVLENQIRESEYAENELEEKIISAVELLKSFRNKRDAIRKEHGRAIQDLEMLRSIKAERSASTKGRRFPSFSFGDINEATCSFDLLRKIGDGRYGSVYQGVLCQAKVAIKMLPGDGSQEHWSFEDKVERLSRVRHPNLVTLTGFSSESRALIYEYVERGSLEYQLDNSRFSNKPLPWRTRVCIASDLCSLLIFLHSNEPLIVHGNLNPFKILLDHNFTCKVSGLGILHLIPRQLLISNLSYKAATDGYVDPESLRTEKLTPEMDVYSFGLILLRLLTGRNIEGIIEDVRCALACDQLESVLDFSAGDWPIHQANKLACLALRCCEREPSNRPNLESDIWAVLEDMRNSSIASDSCLHLKQPKKAPQHFVCPIYQDVMKDPYTAADGFTYEGEAIKEWLNGGHKTSPLTNLQLEHSDLVPNHALYYAIQDWLKEP